MDAKNQPDELKTITVHKKLSDSAFLVAWCVLTLPLAVAVYNGLMGG